GQAVCREQVAIGPTDSPVIDRDRRSTVAKPGIHVLAAPEVGGLHHMSVAVDHREATGLSTARRSRCALSTLHYRPPVCPPCRVVKHRDLAQAERRPTSSVAS